MNAGGMGGGGGGGSFRRDDGGRGKRGGDNRRQNAFQDNSFSRTSRSTPVDTSKLKNIQNIQNVSDTDYYFPVMGSFLLSCIRSQTIRGEKGPV